MLKIMEIKNTYVNKACEYPQLSYINKFNWTCSF